MSREVLHLPEPARTLLRTTFETLDSTLVEIVPEGKGWHLGGGTVLAARWAHRKSTDVDIFLPANSGIAALDPRWNPRFTNAMNALGASRVEVQDRSLKFSFATGRIEITQLDPTPDMPLEPVVVDDRDMTVYSNSQILTGKLHGRGKLMGPEGVATFNQDQRLIMAMTSSGKPLISALKELSGRMLAEHGSPGDVVLPLVREDLATLRAERVLDRLKEDPSVSVEQTIDEIIEAFNQDANPQAQ